MISAVCCTVKDGLTSRDGVTCLEPVAVRCSVHVSVGDGHDVETDTCFVKMSVVLTVEVSVKWSEKVFADTEMVFVPFTV